MLNRWVWGVLIETVRFQRTLEGSGVAGHRFSGGRSFPSGRAKLLQQERVQGLQGALSKEEGAGDMGREGDADPHSTKAGTKCCGLRLLL